MKKLVKSMAALLMVAGVVGFMGCKQPTSPEKTGPQIVEFGIWPQTKYSGEENKLQPCDEGINAWEQSVCFTDGIDNYIKVEKATPCSSCTQEFTRNSTYYFKLEPIQWRVLSNDYNGKKLLFAEKALAASCFYNSFDNRNIDNKTIYPNNYKESDIRTYLNNDFINKAFTIEEIAKIPETNVDNSWQSTFGTGEESKSNYKEHEYACENTKDKIFLLSEKEVTEAKYGFDAYNKWVGDSNGTTTSTRIRKTTDYARATGAWIGSGDLINNSAFWLRSPIYSLSNYARYVDYGGDASSHNGVNITWMGVVPALSMSF